MPDRRWLQILRLLYEEDAEVSLRSLADQLDISERTVRTLLEQNQDFSSRCGVTLEEASGGIRLHVTDFSLFQKAVSRDDMREDETDFRTHCMVCLLLRADDYVRIETLADEMHLSRISLDRLMPKLKMIVAEYGLRVVSRPKYGIRLEGSEKARRICYVHCMRDQVLDYPETLTVPVQKILLSVLQEYGLALSDTNFYNLVQHCVIAIRRIMSGNSLENEEKVTWAEEAVTEEAAAAEIVRRLEETFLIEIPAGEEQYIVMHLLGIRILDGAAAITGETLGIVDAGIGEFYARKGINLGDDTELRAALALHIQPLLSRLRYGLKQDNPILQEIKTDMTEGYELALCAVDVLERSLGLRMDENEAGYLALHLTVALEKRREALPKKKILVVCASGRGTARLIRHRLTERYHFNAEDLVLCSALLLDETDFSDVQCILSTIPLPDAYPVPVIRIDVNLSEQSMSRIDRFLEEGSVSAKEVGAGEKWKPNERLVFPDMTFHTRDEVLDFLCEKAASVLPLPHDFREQVNKRESLSTTEVGNQTALPHPYIYDGTEPVFAFLTLKTPVRWKFQQVRLVILMALPSCGEKDGSDPDPQMELIADEVTRLVCDKAACHHLISSLSADTVGEEMDRMGRETKG